MTSKTRITSFGDLIAIALDRAQTIGTVQTEVADRFKGWANEYYTRICTERNWTWRKFDRSIVFKKAVTTGTVSVINGSRTIVFSGLAHDDTTITRTLQINATNEMYRIIGYNPGKTEAYIEAPYVGTTDAVAGFKLYQYEFGLPPNCDTVSQVFCEGQIDRYGQIDEINNAEFNRCMSSPGGFMAGPVMLYTRDGTILANPTLPVLDRQVADYDFLGAEKTDTTERIRFFPPEPDIDKLIHLSYSIHVVPMQADGDRPIMPVDDRWVLLHYMLYEWWKQKGNFQTADRELRDAEKMLREMRDEQRKTDIKPKLIIDGRRFTRQKTIERDDTRFRIARIAEGSS